MHSRIFQIEKEAISEDEYIDSDSIPEWFTNVIADYTSDDNDRQNDIDWLMTAALNEVATAEKDKLIFSSDVRRYFKEKHEAFVKAAEKLSQTPFDDFVSKYAVDSVLFNLKEAYSDRYGFYVYIDDDLVTLDDFMRDVKDGEVYYFGGVVDYHF